MPWWARPMCGGGLCVALPALFVRDLITGNNPSVQTTTGIAVIIGVCVLAVLYLAALPWRIRRADQRIEVVRNHCNDVTMRSQIDALVGRYGSLGVANDIYLGRAIQRVIECPDRPYNHIDIESALSAYSA